MLTLNDGRSELWQWDTGRKLTVDADCTQVHFSNKFFGRSVDVDVVDGVAEIPDVLLQVDKDLLVWAFVGTPENGYTKISKVFKVNKRNKPAGYVFTPPEQTTLGELIERLDKIEESQDPDAIKNAVDDYLANNPIEIDEKDPTVPEWAKQSKKPTYTAKEVGALPADTVIPTIPDNVSAFRNDAGYLTEHQDLTGYATEQYVQGYAQPKGEYLTVVPDGYAKTEDIPTKPGDIGAQPEGDYLTEVPTGYATEEFVKNKIAEAELGGEEVDLSGYAQKSELPTKVSQLQNDSGYLTEHQDISGKLDASALPTAINTALAQAKASGEFDGADGKDGQDGKDGTSATHRWNGTVLTVTSASGTSSADLKGAKGDKGDKGDSIKGDKGDKGDTGATGQRGTGLLSVTTAPSSYTTAVGGITPKYRMSLSTIKTQAGVTEVLLGDTIRYSYYQYPIEYLDASYAYCTTRISVRGTTGTDGKTAYQYAQDGGYAGTETEFAEKLANEYTLNPLYGKKISLIGDSICAGADDDTSYLGGYGKIIADRNNMVYENLARAGSTVTAETYSSTTGDAKGWISRMVESMSADADYAIVEGGINDAWQWHDHKNVEIGALTTGYNATLDDTTYYGAFESMLKKLVTKFKGKKIGYIAIPKTMSLYDSNQNAPNFYHIALECCAKWGVPVCDLNTIIPPTEYLKTLGTEYTADGTHPTYEGYLKYYCDPIEAWMKTLTTGASVSVGGGSVETDDFVSKNDIQIKKAQLTLEDGSTVLIDVVVASAGTTIQTYMNLLPTSIDTDKSVYNKDSTPGWKEQTRLSASSGSVKECTSGASVTGFFSVKAGDIVRFKFNKSVNAWDKSGLNAGWNIIAYYNSSFTWLGSICPLQSNSAYGICTAANTSSGSIASGGVVSFTVPANSDIEYLRLSFSDQNNAGLKSLIVTVNQEIT